MTLEGQRKVTYPSGMVIDTNGRIIIENLGQASLIKPFTSLLAASGFFTEEDYEALNAEEFYININDGSGSVSSVVNNTISFSVWVDGTKIETKNFTTKTIGSNVFLDNPSAFENWAGEFVGVGNELTFNLPVKTIPGSNSQNVVVSVNDGTGNVASHSYTVSKYFDPCAEFGCDPL
tara:strand:+ start:2419 stop:2949 length:531 start_codon:yes stop_codon:yes gene_type:complete